MVLRAKQVSGDEHQQKSEPLRCPRCGSINTKFCYYNNYNKSQPRHFCKSCKRHWTKDGTLRNVPVGGGARKNKRRPTISKTPEKFVIKSVPSHNAATDQQQCSDFSSFIAGICADHEKGMPHNNILHQGLSNQSSSSSLLHSVTDGIKNEVINDASRTGMNNVPAAVHQNLYVETTKYPKFSDLSAFDENDPLIINPTSYQSMNVHTDQLDGNVHTIEESIITSVDFPSTRTISPWRPETTSSAMDLLPSYWNWSEIDAISNQDDLDISWADVDTTVIKP